MRPERAFWEKVLLVLLAVMIMFPGSAFAAGEAADKTGIVHIEIDFQGNLIFNKYDVDFMVDETSIATIPHGEDFDHTLTLSYGKHKLLFYKSGDHSVSVSRSFNIASDELTISVNLSVDKKEITLNDFHIRDDAAIAAREAKEKEEAERKVQEEKERKEIAKLTDKLCAAAPNDDDTIQSTLKNLGNKVITFTGYVAYVSEVNDQSIVLIRSGRASSTSITGPDFQIICGNLSELPYKSDADLKIEKGLELKVEAKEAVYDEESNIITLTPAKLSSRGSDVISMAVVEPYAAETVAEVQAALNDAGFDCGMVDGSAGRLTHAAIGQYKKTHNLGNDTELDDELITYLRVLPEIRKKNAEKMKAEAAAAEAAAATEISTATAAVKPSENESRPTPTYIGNAKSKKFHKPSCSSVNDMNESNKVKFYGSREEVISAGFEPCKRCKP